jgi:hypothetical protein
MVASGREQTNFSLDYLIRAQHQVVVVEAKRDPETVFFEYPLRLLRFWLDADGTEDDSASK